MNDIAILYHSLGMLCAFGLGYYLRGARRRIQRDPVSRELPMTRQEARRRKAAEKRPPVLHTNEQRQTIRKHLTEESEGWASAK